MIVGSVEIRLYAPWVHSLKEKRMTVKSLIAKTEHKFHIAVAEVAEQDTHQTIVLGLACVANSAVLASQIIDRAVAFIEANTEAEITDIKREIG